MQGVVRVLACNTNVRGGVQGLGGGGGSTGNEAGNEGCWVGERSCLGREGGGHWWLRRSRHLEFQPVQSRYAVPLMCGECVYV